MKKLLIVLLMAATSATVAQVSHSGSWIEKSYEVEGKWEIVKNGEVNILRFDKDFDTKKAPDLKIFLSKLSYDDVTKKNATSGTEKIAELKEYEGAQQFTIPAGIKLSDYKTLLIHCEQYGVLWSVAKLN